MGDKSSFEWHGYQFEYVAPEPMVTMSGNDDGEFPEHFSVEVSQHDHFCTMTGDPEVAKRELLDHLAIKTLPRVQAEMAKRVGKLVSDVSAMQADLSAERYSEDEWPQPKWYREYREKHPIAKVVALRSVKR